MSTITFGSVGDIISVCLLLRELVECLDKARGSAGQYQALSTELRSLDRALLEAGQLLHIHKTKLGSSARTIAQEVEACNTSLQRLRDAMQKYDKIFQEDSSPGVIRRLGKSVQWYFEQKDTLPKFRSEIAAHFNSLSMVLITANVSLSLQLSENASSGLRTSKVGQQLTERLGQASGLLASMNTLLMQAYGKIDMHTKVMSYVKAIVIQTLQTTQSGFQISLATYNAVVTIQRYLASPLERYSLIEEPLILDDAMGRIAPVHLQFITSWKAFDTVLRIRFEGLRGYGKVKRKEFVLQERATSRDISHVIPWMSAFRPGQFVEMSLVFRESVVSKEGISSSFNSSSDWNVCPNCQARPDTDVLLDISCVSCGMIYRRVEQVHNQTTEDASTGSYMPYWNRSEDSDPPQRREIAINAKLRRKIERKRNDLQQYRRILGSFKRIRILSTHEIQKQSTSGGPSQSPVPTESPGGSWKSVTSSFLGLDSHHPASDWCYYFPTDDKMLDLEDMKHRMLELVCGDIIFSPVKDNLHSSAGVMDLGNGSGVWALFVADRYPDAIITGVDIKPSAPKYVPPNLTFIIDDLEKDWMLEKDADLHYIHARDMTLAVQDWPRLLAQAFQNLKPGGWLELQYIDYHPLSLLPINGDDNIILEFWKRINDGLASLGIDHNISAEGSLRKLIEDQGFQNVKEHSKNIPIGRWVKDEQLKLAGCFCTTILSDGADAIANVPLMKGLGWDAEVVQAFTAAMRETLRDSATLRKYQLYFPFRVVYAQKPRCD